MCGVCVVCVCVVVDLLTGDLPLHAPSFSLSVSAAEEHHITPLFHKQNDVFGGVSDGQFQSLRPPSRLTRDINALQ